MPDSVEIVFVIGRDGTPPTPEQLRDSLNSSDKHDASISGPESVYVTDTTEGAGVGCGLEMYDQDADWYTLPSLPAVILDVTLSQLESDECYEENLKSLLEHVVSVYKSLEGCQYVYGLDDEHSSKIAEDAGPGMPVSVSSLSKSRIETVSWLMLFSSPMVAEYGREWLLNAPVWKTQELDDGSVMLVSSPDPTSWEEFRAARSRLNDYFDRK